MIVLNTCYLPPVCYMALLSRNTVCMDHDERYVKQNLRTRCHILSPNGVQTLIIPVVHENLNQSLVKEVRISYTSHWRRQHFRSIQAAYGKSAYFEHYEDDLMELFDKKYDYLWEFNLHSIRLLASNMGLNFEFSLDFHEIDRSGTEIGSLSDISKPEEMPIQKRYLQVFSDRFPFCSGLSSLDLLMNLGPQCKSYLLDWN